ncbi:hypothetical protein VE00_10400 [Pseudogymnoascus sp. WSF 3629]|nr:hypothetical protein VE00_10400 [Pseudogymnoascus sp. WSF 3629]
MEKDRINAQGDPDGPDSSSSFSSSASVWYFAYGSNMRASVMTGRGLHIAATQAVVLPSHMLTFDIFGIPYTEPAMASISPRPRPHSGIQNRCGIPLEQAPDVHGAAYLLSKSDFTKLVLSEGAGTAYREIEVEALVLPPPGNVTDTSEVTVEVTSASTSIRAKTLVARYPFRPNAAPSARYLDVLVQGAQELGLPVSYVEYLQSLPRFTKAAAGKEQLGAKSFIAFWMPLASHLMRWVKFHADDENGRAPEWMGGLPNLVERQWGKGK